MHCMIISRFCSHPSVYGPAQHARTFAKLLKTNGHQVSILSGEFIDEIEYSSQDGYNLIKVPIKKISNTVERSIEITLRNQNDRHYAKTVFKKYKPDIVHIGVPKQLSVYIDEVVSKKIPIISILHSYEWFCVLGHLIDSNGNNCEGPENDKKCFNCVIGSLSKKRKIAFYISRVFGQILPKSIIIKSKILNSHYILKNLFFEAFNCLKVLRKHTNVMIVQNEFSFKFFKKYSSQYKRSIFLKQWLTDNKLEYHNPLYSKKDSILRIGYAGGIGYYKGLDIIVSALNHINQTSKIEFWLLSTGIDDHTIKKKFPSLIENHNLKIFNDLVNEDKYLSTLSSLDVCIIPSICYETGPRVAIESIAQKVPCVASDTVGNKYLIRDNINGKIFQSGNHIKLAEIILNLLHDRSILKKWRKNLPKIQNWEPWYKKIEHLHLEEVAKNEN